MSAEITKVTLKLGKREIEMTVEEARNLKAALEGLFGKEVVKEIVRDGCHHWWFAGTAVQQAPVYPIYGGVNTGTPLPPEPYTVSYESGNLMMSVS